MSRVKTFEYVVTVTAQDREKANIVMIERIGPDEDYGFEYAVDWRQPREFTLAEVRNGTGWRKGVRFFQS